jgi:hypothetical protein
LAPLPPQRAEGSQLLQAGPPARRRDSTQCLRLLPRHAPFRHQVGFTPIQPGRRHRRSPSHVPCKSRRPGSRRLYAGHRLASTRAPSKLIPGVVLPPGSDATFSFTTPQRRRLSPGALERLPGPHLTYQVRLFPVAHHDGLQPTQHRVVWRQPPQADAGRPTIFHLLHSTASERCLHRPSFTFMTHRTNDLDGHLSVELPGDPSRSLSVAEGRVPVAPDPPFGADIALMPVRSWPAPIWMFGVAIRRGWAPCPRHV